MFQNYLVVALRNFVRHRLYSFINVAGLTVGLVCALFIILFLKDETSYDKWIPDSGNLYRVEAVFTLPGQAPMHVGGVPFPIPPAMQEHFPEVQGQTHLTTEGVTVIIEDRTFSERADVVDPGFFQLLKLPLVSGNAAQVFSQPDSVVLSQTMARKYFGDNNPMGKNLTVVSQTCDETRSLCHAEKHLMTVTGVLRDLPHNTQIRGDIFFPVTSSADQLPQKEKEAWLDNHGFGFVRLAPGADPAAVVTKTLALIDRSVDIKKLADMDLRGSQILQIRLTPFQDVHLSTEQFGGMTTAGSWTTVYGFAIIGILIQLVACFNFTNLATARATMRAREVSLRKVMGAKRKQLIVQFMGESVLLALLALVLALALAEVLLPVYAEFLDRPITFHYLRDWPLTLGVIGVAIISGVLSGVYPALVLSKFRPAAILRTNQTKQGGSNILRTSLVVVQFAVSIGLGIAALVIFAQTSFARNIDMGFRRDNIVVMAASLPSDARESFSNALRANPNIIQVASSWSVPLDGNSSNWVVHAPGYKRDYACYGHRSGVSHNLWLAFAVGPSAGPPACPGRRADGRL